jgi:hypothetical protein
LFVTSVTNTPHNGNDNPHRKVSSVDHNLAAMEQGTTRTSWYIMQDDGGDYLLLNQDTAIEYFPTLDKAQCYIQRNGNEGDTVNITYKVNYS